MKKNLISWMVLAIAILLPSFVRAQQRGSAEWHARWDDYYRDQEARRLAKQLGVPGKTYNTINFILNTLSKINPSPESSSISEDRSKLPPPYNMKYQHFQDSGEDEQEVWISFSTPRKAYLVDKRATRGFDGRYPPIFLCQNVADISFDIINFQYYDHPKRLALIKLFTDDGIVHLFDAKGQPVATISPEERQKIKMLFTPDASSVDRNLMEGLQ